MRVNLERKLQTERNCQRTCWVILWSKLEKLMVKIIIKLRNVDVSTTASRLKNVSALSKDDTSPYCAHSKVSYIFYFLSCKTSQNVNILQLLTWGNLKFYVNRIMDAKRYSSFFITWWNNLAAVKISEAVGKRIWKASKNGLWFLTNNIDPHSIERDLQCLETLVCSDCALLTRNHLSRKRISPRMSMWFCFHLPVIERIKASPAGFPSYWNIHRYRLWKVWVVSVPKSVFFALLVRWTNQLANQVQSFAVLFALMRCRLKSMKKRPIPRGIEQVQSLPYL